MIKSGKISGVKKKIPLIEQQDKNGYKVKIGLNIIQGASLVSAYPIIAIDLYSQKLSMSRKMGATHTINAKKVNPESFVVITGCFAQLKPESISKIDGVDMVVGANDKFNLLTSSIISPSRNHPLQLKLTFFIASFEKIFGFDLEGYSKTRI